MADTGRRDPETEAGRALLGLLSDEPIMDLRGVVDRLLAVEQEAVAQGAKVTEARWQAVERVLKAERGSRMELVWNGSGRCYTVRMVDGAERWLPAIDEHPLWAAGRPTAIEALDEVARLVGLSEGE